MPNPIDDIQSENGLNGNRSCVTLHRLFRANYPFGHADLVTAAQGTPLQKDLLSKRTWQTMAAGQQVSLKKFMEAADAIAVYLAKKHGKAVTYGMLADPPDAIGAGPLDGRAGRQYVAELDSLRLIDAPWICRTANSESIIQSAQPHTHLGPAANEPEPQSNELNDGKKADDSKPKRSERLNGEPKTHSSGLSCQLVGGIALPLIVIVGFICYGFLPKSTYIVASGRIDVLVERSDSGGVIRLLELNQPGALPICTGDKFNIDVTVSSEAYVYVVWIDPGHDVTPVFPWDPKIGWGSRSNSEKPLKKTLTLPTGTDRRYEAPETTTGIATIVMFATKSPLSLTDTQLSDIFSGLPELPLPDNEEQGVVWFENYREVRDPDLVRTFKVVESGNPFARWQSQLQEKLGENVIYQTSVSFARLGRDR